MTTAIVVGGGFYGATIAAYLKTERGVSDVTLFEAGPRLLGEASFVNQARVHAGYHYLRSFTTAYRSRVNYPRFLAEYGEAVVSFQAVYALAARNSKVTPRQMERFCADIGAPLASAPEAIAALFNPRTVARAYLADEAAFDAERLARLSEALLARSGVDVRLNAEVEAVRVDDARAAVEAGGRTFRADLVFNCTYSRLQALASGPPLALKHELTEMALVRPPPELDGLGITVMDGPFFSCMPFPSRGLHSLSHVRYTPHMSWTETGERDPRAVLTAHAKETRVDRMLRDAARYVPSMARAGYEGSLFTVKTVLARNEGDDGRPILFERRGPGGRLVSVLGGKIDNVFDVLARLDEEALP
ncbi:NAD(P)/FAD-dependent oxidoreductase [Phenylobacterium sp. VNQ135]|uniref:NAD(P)/FAD-dependent oxidoreductase n=1 Tax=Phenylobacterium sp. VNQ135 TaxID=3400922 RepID=UPI003C07AC09